MGGLQGVGKGDIGKLGCLAVVFVLGVVVHLGDKLVVGVGVGVILVGIIVGGRGRSGQRVVEGWKHVWRCH